MSGELQLGLVGCGRLAERGYLPAIERATGIRLVGTADPVTTRCRRLAADVPAHDSAAALLAAGNVEAVVLATPAAAHLADARLAAQGGVAALVEKPPAPDARQAARLAALDPPPRVGFNRRFEPTLARLRETIPANGGLDLSITLHYPAGSWGSYVVADDPLLAIGPHLIDLARWLTAAEIEQVRATEITSRRACLELSLERGRASLSCATDLAREDRVEVRGAGGHIIARHAAGGLVRRALMRLSSPLAPNSLVASLVRELEAFRRAAGGADAFPLATAADGLAVMAAIDAARRSSRQGARWCDPEPRVI